MIAELRKLGKLLERNSGAGYKSKSRQVVEMARLALGHDLYPGEYFMYGFSAAEHTAASMTSYLSVRTYWDRVVPAMADRRWVPLLRNKWLFHVHFEKFGIPLARMVGFFHPLSGFSTRGGALRTADDLRQLLLEAKPASLVMKPVDGSHGADVLVLSQMEYDAGIVSARTSTGTGMSFEQIVARLDGTSFPEARRSGVLIQERLRQHAILEEINPHTINTVRVVTFLNDDGVVDIYLAAARLGRKGAMVDNTDSGGIAVAIDVGTGALGKGMTEPKYGGEWFDTHPDTGVKFAGMVLPHWPAVLDVCGRAARATPLIRSVGWDVVITPTGPVLLEGNHDWGVPLVQIHSKGMLRPEFRHWFAQCGLEFPAGKYRPPTLGRLVRTLRSMRK